MSYRDLEDTISVRNPPFSRKGDGGGANPLVKQH